VWARHHQQRPVLVEDKRDFVQTNWPGGARSSSIVRSIEDGRDGVQGIVAPKFVRFTPRVRLLAVVVCSLINRTQYLENIHRKRLLGAELAA